MNQPCRAGLAQIAVTTDNCTMLADSQEKPAREGMGEDARGRRRRAEGAEGDGVAGGGESGVCVWGGGGGRGGGQDKCAVAGVMTLGLSVCNDLALLLFGWEC